MATATMKAFVMRRIGDVAVIEKPRPRDPGPNGAIVRTTMALVCSSDVHTIKPLIVFGRE